MSPPPSRLFSLLLSAAILWIVVLLLAPSAVVDAQTTTQPPPTTSTTEENITTTSTTVVAQSTTSATSSTSSPPVSPPSSASQQGETSLQANTSLYADANTCMGMISKLKHPQLSFPGAKTGSPLCIPTPVGKWNLTNGTRTINLAPSDDELDDCIATCNMLYKQRSSLVTVIYMFGKCYCWHSTDFHDETQHDTECCKHDIVYEDYMFKSKCLNGLYGNVFTTTMLCPVNVSLCGTSQVAKEHCETFTKNSGEDQGTKCCIPKGSMEDRPTWGMAVAQYTIVFICVLALFQVLYWILRKRRDDDDDDDHAAAQEQPRLLVVPMLSSDAPITVTQAGRSDQSAIHAAKDIISLFPQLTAQELATLNDDDDSCSFCLDPLRSTKSVKLVVCSHMFHYNCLLTYLAHKLRDSVRQVTCPVCRAVAVDASINSETNPGSPSSSSATASTAASPTTTGGGDGGRSSAAASSSSSYGAAPPAASSSTTSRNGSRRHSPEINPLHSPLLGSTTANTALGPSPPVLHLVGMEDVEMAAVSNDSGSAAAAAGGGGGSSRGSGRSSRHHHHHHQTPRRSPGDRPQNTGANPHLARLL